MTKEEFDALGITKFDLVSILHKEKDIYVGAVCVKDLAVMSGEMNSFVLIASNPYLVGYEAHGYKVVLRRVESIEIIKKDFWR